MVSSLLFYNHNRQALRYFKSEDFLQLKSVRTSVRLERISFIVNLGRLELSYRFQTLYANSYSSYNLESVATL